MTCRRFPSTQLLPELTRTLGRSPFEVFKELNTIPQGSASIAQVHRARLQDGTPVVLKIRRPGIRTKVEADLRLLGHLAQLIDSEMPDARRYQPIEIAAQFARSLERELDFTIEANNIERFAHEFRRRSLHRHSEDFLGSGRASRCWSSSTSTAFPGSIWRRSKAAGLDKRVLAARGAEAILRMILIDGFFHADPHPGNVFYLPGNRIVLIDFGMVGRLAPRRRREVIDLLAGLARMEEEPMLDVLLDWAEDAFVEEAKLAADVNELAFEFEGVALADIRIGTLIRRFAAIVRDHSIVLPADLTLMFKALVTMEGLGRQYDPNFYVVEHLDADAARLASRALSTRTDHARGRSAINDFVGVLESVPRDFGRLLREARRGRTRVDLDLKRLDSFGHQLEQTIDRATMGIMTASLVIGSAIVMTVPVGRRCSECPRCSCLGLLGYIVAFMNSVWILYGIWRSGKR